MANELTKIEKFKTFNNKIAEAQKKGQSAIMEISASLAIIAEEKLYLEGGYKDVYEYAKMVHGISRGSVSEAINVMKSFGKIETGELLPEFHDYTFNQLVELRKLPEQERNGITPKASVRDLKERVKQEREKKEETKKSNRKKVVSLKFEAADEKEAVKKLGEALKSTDFKTLKSINIKIEVKENK